MKKYLPMLLLNTACACGDDRPDTRYIPPPPSISPTVSTIQSPTPPAELSCTVVRDDLRGGAIITCGVTSAIVYDGSAGPAGEPGSQGAAGPQGEPGRQGQAGQDGKDGQQGVKGEDGSAGPTPVTNCYLYRVNEKCAGNNLKYESWISCGGVNEFLNNRTISGGCDE